MPEVSLVVLAGGRSSRMGGEDKAVRPYRGRPMLEWALDAFAGLVDESVVVARDAAQLEHISSVLRKRRDLRFAVDDVTGFGPTAGLVAGFATAGGALCFMAACDMPYISTVVAAHIISCCREADAAVPRWADGRMEPLFACYRREPTLAAARRAMAHGFRKVLVPLYELERIAWVPVEDELRPLDPGLRTFENVNTPDEWNGSSDSTGNLFDAAVWGTPPAPSGGGHKGGCR